MRKQKIIATTDFEGGHYIGQITGHPTVADISKVLGFKPNCGGDGEKVEYEWKFRVGKTGPVISIYDYRGDRWHIGGNSADHVDALIPFFADGSINKWGA